MNAADAAGAVLVTRPGEAGRQLARGLQDAGTEALWWPAFDLLEAPDPGALRELAGRLQEFDLVIFVSPAAVRAWVELDLRQDWPTGTAIAAVGGSSLDLARHLLPGTGQARFIAPMAAPQAGPDPEGSSGSEALWPALAALLPGLQRVLIVRAESGREWLAQKLEHSGAEVRYASVYRRVEHRPGDLERAALQDWLDRGLAPACLVTSSEAVGALDRQLADRADQQRWLRGGLALCTHERIGRALRDAGYRRVALCEPSVDSLREAIGRWRSAAEGAR